SAGVVIDAVRCAKLALDRGIGGALVGPASYFMKSPPQQFSDEEAHARTEEFIREKARENPQPPAEAAAPSTSARKGRAAGTNGTNRINGNGNANGRHHHAAAGNGRI